MKRNLLLGFIVGLIVLLAVHWLSPPPRFPRGVYQVAIEAPPHQAIAEELGALALSRKVERQLDTLIPELVFDGMPLKSVLDRLAAIANVRFRVDWDITGVNGMLEGLPIYMEVKNQTVRQILRRLLEWLNDPGQNNLAYQVEAGVVRISSSGRITPTRVSRVYDVRDLIERGIIVSVKMEQARQKAVAAGGPPPKPVAPYPGGLFGGPPPPPPLPGQEPKEPSKLELTEREVGDDLIAAIVNRATDPVQAGGTGHADYFAGRLVVTGPLVFHASVSRALADIRNAKEVPK